MIGFIDSGKAYKVKKKNWFSPKDIITPKMVCA